MKKIGFVSLGCEKNRIDTEIMLHELHEAGYEITGEPEEADYVVVNTCAFIESAKKESIDNILDLAWLKENANLKGLVVTGCLAERYRDEVMREMPEVDAVLGVGSIHRIVEAIRALEASAACRFAAFDPAESLKLGGDRIVTTSEYLGYLKVAEGCDNRCTYCVIPSIRGRFRSRPMEDLVAEAVTLESLGVKELILIAQDTTRYGIDLYGSYKLDELIDRICEATAIPWIRLLYCYPDKITDGLIAQLRDNPRVVKYLDIPIQHIADGVLRRMNRRGDGAMIRSVIARLRAEVPGIVLRTTAIAGFPGETEEEFEELCRFVGETKFERFGVFAYSREEGTPAYDMPDQIDEQVKQDRCDILMQKQQEISAAYNEGKIGEAVTVLVEGFDPVSEAWYGRSQADAPEIDGKVFFTLPPKAKKPAEGAFVTVRVTDVLDYDLIGELEA